MATQFIPYSGPGYPDLQDTGKQVNAGLAGLVSLQKAAGDSRLAAAADAITERRASRTAELEFQKAALSEANTATRMNLEAVQNLANLRRGRIAEREAHEPTSGDIFVDHPA